MAQKLTKELTINPETSVALVTMLDVCCIMRRCGVNGTYNKGGLCAGECTIKSNLFILHIYNCIVERVCVHKERNLGNSQHIVLTEAVLQISAGPEAMSSE